MNGKIVSVVKNSCVIKPDIKTDESIKQKAFNPNKILNYKIFLKDKIIGKISNVIGRTDNFFLVGELNEHYNLSTILDKDVEILKEEKKKKGKKYNKEK